MRRLGLLVVIAVAAVIAIAATSLAGPGASGTEAAASEDPAPTTATVTRQTLTSEVDLDGELGYDGETSILNWLPGVVTALPEPGTVVERGDPLYELDGRPGPIALYGNRPAWRELGPEVADGADVLQLEQNLQALGYFPADEVPDSTWDEATTDAVRAFQEAEGLPEDDSLALGEVVFVPWPIRISEVALRLGEQAAPVAPALTATSTERTVILDVPVNERGQLSEGDAVAVELPDGTTLPGTVAEISSTVTGGGGGDSPDSEASEPTVAVTVTLDEAPPDDLSVAPVTVHVVTDSRVDVLAVPVSALLALVEGGYAVEVVGDDGTRSLVGVDVGLFADGWVEIEADELVEGDRVVVPR